MRKAIILLMGAVAVSSLAARASTQTTVTLELRDTPTRTALYDICKRAGISFLIEPVVPEDGKVTLSFKTTPLEEALQQVCTANGLLWRKEGPVYVVTAVRVPSPAGSWLGSGNDLRFHASRFSTPLTGLTGLTYSSSPGALSPNALIGNALALARPDDRSTFSCPHCKASVTVVGKKNHCVRCLKPLQSDWVYCPYDGGRRVTPLDDWKVCPFCAKAVK